ncbi:MAG: hypothetical protein WBV45_07770 [Lutimonas sp.]
MTAQQKNELPYAEIPPSPDSYTAGGVVSRMIDGLGFRYYWATEGLRSEDLIYKPSPEARTSEETIDHILGLSYVVLNSALQRVNEPREEETLTFDQKRARTLENLEQASHIFRSVRELGDYPVVFKGKESNMEYPFWNQINGPISDAIWHCGQLVSFRRGSGNPFNSKVSVFSGKLRD